MSALKNELQYIHHTVGKHFVQANDEGESWDMPPEGYNGRQWLRDDCDGFCLACRVLLRDRGIPSRLVYCELGRSGHLVVEVQGWILDLRQSDVVANTLLPNYRWLRISGYEAGEPWREIVNSGTTLQVAALNH
ncbi:MAG: putative transglutaminase-like cysteine proteinase [Zhongshania marina]|jgi:predicted transglutaminase-like cysteine proteinase